MLKRWKAELNQFILLIIIGGVSGWAINLTGWGIAIVLTFYSFWLLIRLRDVVIWIEANDESEAPESTGIWGELLDTLNHQKKHNREVKEGLEDILERAQESTDAIDEAIVVTNHTGAIQWFNQAAVDLLGLQRPTDYQHPITNLVRDPRFVNFFNESDFSQGLEIPSPKDSQIMLQVSVTVFGESNDRLMLGRDITRLHSLEQMRKDFVANVSHELRTPLTVIKGYLETYLESLDPQQQRAIYRGMEQMNQQAIRMELLVSDLLLLSKLETESAHSSVAPVKVPQLLKQVQNDALAMNDEKKHQILLDADASLLLLGIENELRSAFSNLVINAVKYTPPGGTIEIKWWQDDDGAHMSVSDTGIGIDERHIPRLTERFYRADPSRHSKTGGTGLGLAIVKHVLKHHDATLDVKSELDVGSEFICHFPSRNTFRQAKNDQSQSVA
ncbi:MAG: phosphate regulon sensor histidine kinase PhoR [Pseudomonadales bacterium]|nr:phosphate regulon sensor histidine kinase PhoR [Pseudomonadales bacterium]